jgi:hypothetical protein
MAVLLRRDSVNGGMQKINVPFGAPRLALFKTYEGAMTKSLGQARQREYLLFFE